MVPSVSRGRARRPRQDDPQASAEIAADGNGAGDASANDDDSAMTEAGSAKADCGQSPIGSDLSAQHLTPPAQRGLWQPPRLVTNNDSLDAQLSRLVELEVIPRLLLMHGASPSHPRVGPQVLLNEMHVDVLARLAAEGDAGSAGAYVHALLDAGATEEQVFLELLAPAARLLGQKWEDDLYTFSQVTIALWRMQQILHDHRGRTLTIGGAQPARGRALLAVAPGAQHSFGVSMVSDLFGRAGWEVTQVVGGDWPAIKAAVSENWFDILGFSASTASDVAEIGSAILMLRKAAMNARLLIMVGGAATGIPALASVVSAADLVGADVRAALDHAHRWMSGSGTPAAPS